ncbi:MAG: TIGR03862 family flavoprotein [Acidimicrobiales bacterium]
MSEQPVLTRSTRVAVIGGGPGGLMAAEALARAGASVTVFERMPSVGRKLLVAGRGGLNLTHSEPVVDLLDRYGPARPVLAPAVEAFGPDDLRAWCEGLGQPPFVGTSGRVFPSGFRATPLLRAWLRRLDELGVDVQVRHTWRGWAPSGVIVADTAGGSAGVERVEPADAVVLALGGASWPRTGSDGGWVGAVRAEGIDVAPLRPANVGVEVGWTPTFAERFAGTPLKNVRVSVGSRSGLGSGREPGRAGRSGRSDEMSRADGGVRARGDAVVTTSGLEGGVIYAVGRELRDALESDGDVVLRVGLLPDLTLTDVIDRLGRRRPKDSVSTALRRALGLPPVAIGLLREATGNQLPGDADGLASLVKEVPVVVVGVQAIDRAISTAGGIALDEVDESFMLRRRPGTFVAGEMLDWEAPTGGYLLQATFSTAVAAAHGAIRWLTSI